MADGFIRVTFIATRNTWRALARACEISGLTQTNCINHAVQLYEVLQQRRLEGATVMIKHKDGTFEALSFPPLDAGHDDD